MKLSILIPTIPERKEKFDKIYCKLLSQCTPDIEILFDDRERYNISGIMVGEKRQALIDQAKGKYISFVDDDDDISNDYVIEILKAIDSGSPDVITFRTLADIDGRKYVIDTSIHNPIEQLHGNGPIKRKPSVPHVWLKEATKRTVFQSKNVDEDTDWVNAINAQSEIKIDKILHYYNFSTADSVASQTYRVAVVTFANGDYTALANRQKMKVNEFSNYDHFHFTDFGQIQSKSHGEYPYAFKPNAIHTVRRMGYNLILWVDSPVYPIKNFDSLIEKVKTEKILLIDNIGWTIGDFTSDICLQHFTMSRDESFTHPMVMACIMGFNLKDDWSRNVFDTYLGYAHTEAYQGDWHNNHSQVSRDSRVRGHRHDQSVISCIAARRGIKLTHPDGIIAYKNEATHADWLNNSTFISDRGL